MHGHMNVKLCGCLFETAECPWLRPCLQLAVSHISKSCNGNTKGKHIRCNLISARSTVQFGNRTTEIWRPVDVTQFLPLKSLAVTVCTTRFNLQIWCALSTCVVQGSQNKERDSCPLQTELIGFYALSQNYKNLLLALSYLFVCLSVRVKQLGSHRTDFHEFLYFTIFRKFIEDIQVSLKTGKNDGYFTWRFTQICKNYLFVYLFTYLFICLFICLFIYLFVCLLIYLSIYLFVYLFVCLFIYLFICLFIYLFIYLFTYLFICLFIYLFVYLFICLFIYLFCLFIY
jgi:hypothetical protein